MDELDPRLRKQLEALREVPARDPKRAAEGRAHFLRLAEEMKPQNSSEQAVSFGWFRRLKEWIQPKPNTRKEGLKMVNILIAALMAVSVLFGGGAAAAYASQDALPGDTLYPVKQVVEQAELAVTTSPQSKAELHMEFAQERAEEIQALVASGRMDEIPEAVQNMEQHLTAAEQMAAQMAQQQQAQVNGRMAVMMDMAAEALQRAMEKADPHAQQALQMALQRTREAESRAMSRYTRAVQELKEQGSQAQNQMQAGATAMQQAGKAAEGEIFTIKGKIEQIKGNTWVVDGQTVIVPEKARVQGNAQVGDIVNVHGYIDPQGAAVAVQAKVMPVNPAELPAKPEMPARRVAFQGVVEAQNDGQWVIAGQTVKIGSETKVVGQVAVGDWVMVVATAKDGALEAQVITRLGMPAPAGQGQGKGHKQQPEATPSATPSGSESEPTMMPSGMPTMPEPTAMPWGGNGDHDGQSTMTPMPGGHDSGNHDGGNH